MPGTDGQRFKKFVALAVPIGTLTYNLEVEAFQTYFVGDGGVWVHNTCPFGGEAALSVAERMRKEGKSLNEIYLALEKLMTNAADLTSADAKVMASALDNLLLDAFRDLAKVWTPRPTLGFNVWRHYVDHVKIAREFTDVQDPFEYVARARRFLERTDHARLRGARTVIEQDGQIVEETFFMDTASGEFMIRVDSGPSAGAIRTYFHKRGSVEGLIRYFDKQFRK